MPKSFTPSLIRKDEQQVARFVDGLQEASYSKGRVFDSAAADDYVSESTRSQGEQVPKKLQIVLDEAGEYSTSITKALLDSANIYEQAHGTAIPADLLVQAVHSAYSTTDHARKRYALDSGSSYSMHHDGHSLQPSRAIVSILATAGEAIPFANYLPPAINNNEAKLAIMNTRAGSGYGGYNQNASMDGIESGRSYVSSARIHMASDNGGAAFGGKLTKVQSGRDICDQTAAGVKLLRGAALVFVGGMVAGRETDSSGSGDSPVSGTIAIDGTTHVIGGTINTDTGAFAITAAPAIPAGYKVVVESNVDYERAPELTPKIHVAVETFSLFARPWRVTTEQTIDSRTQMSAELGLDPYSQSLLAVNAQVGNERHYYALNKMHDMASQNMGDFDFDWGGQKSAKERASVWKDLLPILNVLSQNMMISTLSYGITHLYVGKNIASELRGLPTDIWQPSGVQIRAGIYRLGRLHGLYDVYYSPHIIEDDATSGEILCIGRPSDTARSPIVLGDAVAATIVPLATNADLNSGAGYYSRQFTAINPHKPSAKGAAKINIINMR